MKTSLAILSLFILASCGSTVEKNENKTEAGPKAADMVSESSAKKLMAIAQLQSKSGSKLSGTVTFTENNGVVSMKAEVNNISAGSHAIHIHEKGDCSADDGKSAGGHWNPTNEDHGKWEKAPFHRGDIGNLEIGENGSGTIDRETNLWCIGCGDESKDIVGKAIIVHMGPDDFSSQPSGAAGARIGCGEITLQK